MTHFWSIYKRWWLSVLFLTTATIAIAQTFTATAVPDSVLERMRGRSYPDGCKVARSDLRYLRLSHWTSDDKEQVGEMVCNKAIADDLLDIFRQLYKANYIIESIRLIDDFDADDERSMCANNTSCFCYRAVAGSKKLSRHALGMAVDINPLYNPCVRQHKDGKRIVQPTTASPYVDRQRSFPQKIDKSDLCYRLFVAHGFRWGGAWKRSKDYQHFEK